MVQELVGSDAGTGGQVGEAFIRLVVVVQELLDEPAEHRQCGLSICTFHLGFSLGYIAQDGFARFMVYPARCRMAHHSTKGVLSTEFHYDTMLTAHYGRYPSFVCLHTARVVQTGSYQPFKAVVVAIPRT